MCAADSDDSKPLKRHERFVSWVAGSHPAARLTAIGIVIFAALFGALGVQNHRNFGTWSYDMGIYDQAFWLVSRGESFISVRGMFFWGHHVNLVVVAFVPFYWLGAGPEFLYVVQAAVLALGAAPLYLITRDALGKERWGQWMGFVIAVVYLMYAPLQWISWAMFHPEALLITPFLFAWWFGLRQRWNWYWAMVLVTLSMREDVALAIILLGPVLAIVMRSAPEQRRVRTMCVLTSIVGIVWYLVATRIVLVVFNDGKQPFYITSFYGNYGSSMPEIVWNMVRRPDTVVSDAVQHDRLTFYKQMMWPVGWIPLANPLPLLMAVPQLLASVIGLSPYARMIRYQYTAVMIAPVMIAVVYGVRTVWRFPLARAIVPIWLLGCAYVTNVAWSPSPLGKPANYAVWSKPHPRHESLRAALSVIPGDASVSASYQLLPHLTHRREAYDWPNPFTPAVWGNDDCGRLPDPRTVEYVALDRTQIGENNRALFEAMIVDGGPFEVVFDDAEVVVLRRVGTSAAVDVEPQRASCDELASRRANG